MVRTKKNNLIFGMSLLLTEEQNNIIQKGNLKDILSLVHRYDKNILLFRVCKFGHLEVVKYFVKYFAEECGVGAYTYAIQRACQNGHLEVVKYLIEECGADARANNDYAVRMACQDGHLEVVKYLVEKCRVNARANEDEPVRWASCNGHLEVVKYLTEKCGADVHAWDDWGVQWACSNRHFEVVKYLVETCGAIISHEITDGYELYVKYKKILENMPKKASKRIYFWWVQICYNPNSLCGQRSIYKGYREYLSMR